MAVSSEMKLRLDKIDKLVEKGYLVKTKVFSFPYCKITSGAVVNPIFRGKYGDDALPAFHGLHSSFHLSLQQK